MSEENKRDHSGPEALDLPSLPGRAPYFPFLLPVSGLYEWKLQIIRPFPTPIPFPSPIPERIPIPIPLPDPPIGPMPGPLPGMGLESQGDSEAGLSGASLIPFWFFREELRLDVDGRYPQMTASGTMYRGLAVRVHWVANLNKVGYNHWKGTIWYKDGTTSSMPYTTVDITATTSWYPSQRKVTVTFSGYGSSTRKVTYKYKSRYFHPVEFEFDTVAGTHKTTSIKTCDHPNRPSSLPCETLTITRVFQRAGFDVKKSGGDSVVPLADAGTNGTWSDMEMHDAMQAYWSRFANKSQWSMWVLFAAQHDIGHGLGGIMFDDIGPNHRQGTAMFNNSFIADAPSNDANPTAWVQRMKFWTAVHEMGHSFNLAHSWQKAFGTPWIPLTNNSSALSFMNYPFFYPGDESAFFADFAYRFIDEELLFMRHAPSRFVQMGNADWFDHHGFEQARLLPEPKFRLELRFHRKDLSFEFMEQVTPELKLTNISSQPQMVESGILSTGSNITFIIKKQNKPARQWKSYVQYCLSQGHVILDAETEKDRASRRCSLYDSFCISGGLNGCDLAEPGVYTLQAVLHMDEEDVVSNPVTIKVSPPQGYDQESIAQDYFTDDVARTLALNGTMFMTKANDVLRDLTERLPDMRASYQAKFALGNPLRKDYKVLSLRDGQSAMNSVGDDNGEFRISRSKPDEARQQISSALIEDNEAAAESFGHINLKRYVDQYSKWLADKGEPKEACKCQDILHKTLAARGVLKGVLSEIETVLETYKSKE